MSSFFTRRRTIILSILFALAFLFWLSRVMAGNSDDGSREGAEAAGYAIGSLIAAPAVLAAITLAPVVGIWWLVARRSR